MQLQYAATPDILRSISISMINDITAKLAAKLQSAKLRYLLVGATVYVLEMLIILIATEAGLSEVQAVAVSFWVGLIVSFGLQKTITFKDKRMQRRVLGLQVIAVIALVVWNFSFTIFLTGVLPLAPTISRTISLLITTLWNYYLYKTRIFRTAGAA